MPSYGFRLAQRNDNICVLDFGGNVKDGGREKGLLDDVRKSLAMVRD